MGVGLCMFDYLFKFSVELFDSEIVSFRFLCESNGGGLNGLLIGESVWLVWCNFRSVRRIVSFVD